MTNADLVAKQLQVYFVRTPATPNDSETALGVVPLYTAIPGRKELLTSIAVGSACKLREVTGQRDIEYLKRLGPEGEFSIWLFEFPTDGPFSGEPPFQDWRPMLHVPTEAQVLVASELGTPSSSSTFGILDDQRHTLLQETGAFLATFGEDDSRTVIV